MAPDPSARRITELDGLRAFAVSVVVLLHMLAFAHSLSLPNGGQRVAEAIGGAGLSVFFVISGYIITTLILREHERTGTVSIGAFYARRFFRIVPAFGLYVLTILALWAGGVIHCDGRSIVVSLLFLGNTTLLGTDSWFVAHTWSLAVEEQFYIVFPLLFCVVLGCRQYAAIKAVAALYAICLVSPGIMHVLQGLFGHPAENVSILYRFRFILTGVLFALLGPSIFQRLRRRPALNALVPIAAGALFALAPATALGRIAYGLPLGAVAPIACGLFVLWFPANPERAGILRLPAAQGLGVCSYGAYLWQQLFTGPRSMYGMGLEPSPFAPLAILGLAVASHVLLERPCIRFGHRLSARIANRRLAGNAADSFGS